MAFQRNYKRSPRALSPKVAFRKFATKRRTWGTDFFQDDCQDVIWLHSFNEEAGVCKVLNPIKIPLVSNDTLQQIFSDGLTVKSIQGWIQFHPVFNVPGITSLDWLRVCQIWQPYLHMGLIKQKITGNSNPANETPTPNAGAIQFDYAEQPWIRHWEKIWPYSAGNKFGAGGSVAGGFAGFCDRTTGSISGGDSADSTLSDGNGLIHGTNEVDGSIDTDCCVNACTIPNDFDDTISTSFTEANFPQPWLRSLNLRFKKGIRMRENDQLELVVSAHNYNLDILAQTFGISNLTVGMAYTGRTRVKVEY